MKQDSVKYNNVEGWDADDKINIEEEIIDEIIQIEKEEQQK